MPRKSARDRRIAPSKTKASIVVRRQTKYREIEAEVRKLVQTLPVGTKMPTERRPAQSYDCSALTIRRGLHVLVDEGAINLRADSATFVAQHSGKLVESEKGLPVVRSTCGGVDELDEKMWSRPNPLTFDVSVRKI